MKESEPCSKWIEKKNKAEEKGLIMSIECPVKEICKDKCLLEKNGQKGND